MTEEKAEEFLKFMINLSDPERRLEGLPPDPFSGEHVNFNPVSADKIYIKYAAGNLTRDEAVKKLMEL
jgi:hypothetical protein